MALTYVDFHASYLGYVDRNVDGSEPTRDEGFARAGQFVESFRDRARANLGSDWQVSDIAESRTGYTGDDGSAFIRIRQVDGVGAPVGLEILLMFPLTNTGGSTGVDISEPRYSVDVFSSIRDYILDDVEGRYTLNGNVTMWFHLGAGNTPGTDTFDGGWDSSGALSGGDWSDITAEGGTDPGDDLVAFLPSDMEFDGFIFGGKSERVQSILFQFDSDENAILISMGDANSPWNVGEVFAVGDIFEISPDNPADTRPDGYLFHRIDYDGTAGEEQIERIGTFDDAGVRGLNYEALGNVVGDYTLQDAGTSPRQGNSPREVDGAMASRKVPVSNPSYNKGWLKPSLFREMGPSDHYFNYMIGMILEGPDATRKWYKYSRYFCMIHPTGLPGQLQGFPLPR